ncbi:hypothetical protein SO802_016322 [Lithocarpus litseifolius]|uniref:Thioesterase domain-containing protein n=1 Tax=Lithocarpus litseifolius TaxID=425828 RepID=A0AAW2D1L8_9ROSI
MEELTATPRPKAEATSLNSSKTIANDVFAEYFSAISAFFQKNFYASLHGGAVAAIAEMVSIACARTVVAEDKDIFLGDMSTSYLSGAPIHAEVMVDCSVVRSGRNLTVVAMELKVKKTGQLAYTAHATFYNMPIAKL